MIESFVLGIVQGIAEWIPISSEGALVLVQTHFFGEQSVSHAIGVAVFLHLGTFFAALVYFRKDVFALLKTLTHYKHADERDKSLFRFLLIATVISGSIGAGLLALLGDVEGSFAHATTLVTGGIGVLLLITGVLQLRVRPDDDRTVASFGGRNSILLGIVQGFAALPGLSRSGLTVSALLLRGYRDDEALRISFLMSLPIVLAGNILLGLRSVTFSIESLIAVVVSFAFGLLSIGILLRLARAVQFGYFVAIFGILMIVAAFI